MKLGLFMMPSHPPERSFYDGQQWDLQVLRWADDYGFDEAWIGEHFTAPWEPNPAPDLLIAQALLQTQRIVLAPGAHLLPYHHPAELAARVAFLDHLAKGRFMFGIGASGLPSDWATFDVDGANGENRRMMWESLDVILKLWESPDAFEHRGEYWNVNRIDPMLRTLRHHLTPYQKPHPPIGVAGLTPGSDTLRIAGERGFIPLSLNMSTGYVRSHWEAYAKGAEGAGRPPDRSQWRVVREVLVADSDEEARRWSAGSMMGRMMSEYLLPLFADFDYTQYLKDDPNVSDENVKPEYLVDHGWLVGSVETVTEKLLETNRLAGGFGVLTVLGFDYADNPEPWRRSMQLLATEVLPRVNAELGAAAAG
jgi:alkanesulfonate monooxygenase SsuD/methylene tetrahydromethanopterin reductase-like flavin-dependent oxidoreductase (luciferase family)